MIAINDDELQRHKCIEHRLHSHHNRTLSGCGGVGVGAGGSDESARARGQGE